MQSCERPNAAFSVLRDVKLVRMLAGLTCRTRRLSSGSTRSRYSRSNFLFLLMKDEVLECGGCKLRTSETSLLFDRLPIEALGHPGLRSAPL